MYRFSFLLLFAVSRVTVMLCARDRQDLLSVPGVFHLLDSCYPQYLSLSRFVLQLLLGSDYLCLGPVSPTASLSPAGWRYPSQHHSIPSIPARSSEAPSMLLSTLLPVILCGSSQLPLGTWEPAVLDPACSLTGSSVSWRLVFPLGTAQQETSASV